MGSVTVIKGIDSEKTIYNFNGAICDNLKLNREYCKIWKGSEEISSDYCVEDDDIIIIQEYPGIATTILGLTIGAWIAITAITIGAGLLIGHLFRPKINIPDSVPDNNAKKTETIPFLSGGRNDKSDGRNVPIILGRHLFSPYYLSDMYLEPSGVDGEDLYAYIPFLVGQTGLSYEQIRNGTIPLITFSGNTANSGTFSFDISDSAGMYDVENLIEIIQDEYFSENKFNQKWTDSLQSSIQLEFDDEIIGYTTEIYYPPPWGMPSQRQVPVYAGPIEVERQSAKYPMRLEIEIMLDGLFAFDSRNGLEVSATADVLIEWSRDGDSWQQINIIGWNNSAGKSSITRNKNKQMRFLAVKDFSANEVYDETGKEVFLRFKRLTKHGGGTHRDRVFITAIRTKAYSPKKSNSNVLVEARNLNELLTDKFSRMGVKIKVNQNTQEELDRFNVIACMTGRVWDSSWSTEKVTTTNAAAVALEVLTGLIHKPSLYRDDEISLDSFGKLYEFCEDQKVEIEGQGIQDCLLEANGVLANATKKIEALNRILAACDGAVYQNEFGKLVAVHDAPQSTPIALLNPQRIVNVSENRSLARKTDGYIVSYINEDADWAIDTTRILRKGVDEKPGENTFNQVQLDLCTNYKQAAWLTRRFQAKEIHRPGEMTVAVGKEGRHYAPGSLISFQHERFKVGIGSGEILQIAYNGDYVVGFRTIETFNLEPDRDYTVEYQVVTPERNHVVQRRITGNGRTDFLRLTAPLHKDSIDVPAPFNIISVGEHKRYLVTNASEMDEGYNLTLVQYNPDIYNTGVIRPYVSHLFPAPPREDMFDPLPRPPLEFEDIVEIVEDAAPASPRYRGLLSTPDVENTGIITTNHGPSLRMNPGDFVMYNGGQEGIWHPAHIMKWDGSEWERLDRPSENPVNGWMYLDGISDLARGAPVGVFSDVFVETIAANTAFIRRLYMEQGIMRDPGFLQSESTTNGEPDFIIKSNGEAIFNKATIRGHVEAASGYFHGRIEADSGELNNVIIKEDALFSGNIISGPLKLLNTGTTTDSFYFGIGTNAQYIWNILNLSHDLGNRIYSIHGTYGALSVIALETRRSSPSLPGVNREYGVYLISDNGNRQTVAISRTNYDAIWFHLTTTTAPLNFYFTSGERTFMLDNLPNADPNIPGVVFRSGKQLMIS